MQYSSVGVSSTLLVEDASGEDMDEPPPPHADIKSRAEQTEAMKYPAKTRDILILRLLDQNFD